MNPAPRSSAPRRARRAAPLLALAALLLPACVTESKPSRGITYRSDPASPQAAQPLPAGPVATPAPAHSTSTSRVTFTVRPLGTVPYNGLSLPLTSPAGDFIAVQTGLPPEWSTLLALHGAPLPGPTHLAVYAVTDSGLRPTAAPFPAGLLLGRSADDTGFLVEAPQPGGARWIGRADWQTGSLTWLVRDNRANAHAVLSASGAMIYTSSPATPAPGETSELRILHPGRSEPVAITPEPGGAFLFPFTTSSPDHFGVLLATPRGMEVTGFHAPQDHDAPRPLARRLLAAPFDIFAAFQCVAPLQSPWPIQFAAGSSGDPHSLIFCPAPPGPGMAVYSLESGDLLVLPEAPTAAAIVTDHTRPTPGPISGYLLTAQRSLDFLQLIAPARSAGNLRFARPTSVMKGAQLPRLTSTHGKYLLIGPAQTSRESSFHISALYLLPAVAVPSQR